MKRRYFGGQIMLVLGCVLLLALPLHARTNVKDGFEYAVENNEVVIRGWRGKSADVSIPETIENLPVKVIHYSAFKGKNIRNLTLPEGLARIYTGAFADNKIERIVIPGSLVEIGGDAFHGNPVTRVEIARELGLDEYIGGIPGAFSAFYILHERRNGIYTYQDGVWHRDGQGPPPHAALVGRNYTYIGKIDGNNAGNYIGTATVLIGSEKGFTYILPPGRHELLLHYDGPKFRSQSGMKYTVTLEAGKTYSAGAIVDEASYSLSYAITEE